MRAWLGILIVLVGCARPGAPAPAAPLSSPPGYPSVFTEVSDADRASSVAAFRGKTSQEWAWVRAGTFGFIDDIGITGRTWPEVEQGMPDRLGPLTEAQLDSWIAFVRENAHAFGIDRPEEVTIKRFQIHPHGPAVAIQQKIGDVVVSQIEVMWRGPTESAGAFNAENVAIRGHHWPGARSPRELSDADLVTRALGAGREWIFEPVVSSGHRMRSSHGKRQWRTNEGLHTQEVWIDRRFRLVATEDRSRFELRAVATVLQRIPSREIYLDAVTGAPLDLKRLR